MFSTYVVHFARSRMPANPSQFDVDDSACSRLDRGERVTGIVDALIETQRGSKLRLQEGVRINVIPSERLFDHKQVKLVEAAKMIAIGQAVRGICVHRKRDLRKLLANSGDELQVFARFDLELDPPIPATQFLLDLRYQGLGSFPNAEGNSTLNLG